MVPRDCSGASPARPSERVADLDTVLAQAVGNFELALTRRALELISSGRITWTGFAGVWCVRSSDGLDYYRTLADRCSCPAFAPCYHSAAAALLDQAEVAGLLDDPVAAGLPGQLPGPGRARRHATSKRATRAA
jgi:hypothetical protein